MKVIIHYSNKKSYTYQNYTVDGWVDWDDKKLRLIGETEEEENPLLIDLSEDTLYIEVRDPTCGYYSLWTNPKYEFSVIADVMTAKSRSKANRLNSTQLLVREVNRIIDKHGLEVDISHYIDWGASYG